MRWLDRTLDAYSIRSDVDLRRIHHIHNNEDVVRLRNRINVLEGDGIAVMTNDNHTIVKGEGSHVHFGATDLCINYRNCFVMFVFDGHQWVIKTVENLRPEYRIPLADIEGERFRNNRGDRNNRYAREVEEEMYNNIRDARNSMDTEYRDFMEQEHRRMQARELELQVEYRMSNNPVRSNQYLRTGLERVRRVDNEYDDYRIRYDRNPDWEQAELDRIRGRDTLREAMSRVSSISPPQTEDDWQDVNMEDDVDEDNNDSYLDRLGYEK